MKKRGFTLIEMLIVIVIIGILAGALIPRIGTARDKANDTAREANVRSLATALVSYGLDHGSYEQNLADMDLSQYSIPAGNFAGQPTSKDRYVYTRLDEGTHFVITVLLSEGSDAGNCELGTAVEGSEAVTCTDAERAADSGVAACEGKSAGAIKTPAVPATTGLAADLTTYNDVNAVIGTNGNGFCYLQ